MTNVNLRIGVVLSVLLLVSAFSTAASAQSAEALYKGKCVACHGADGAGSAMGKKMGTHDFKSADVKGMSDADLTAAIAKGKNKMPGYEKSLKPDDIKGLVEYVRALGK